MFTFLKHIPFISSVHFGKSNVLYFLSINPFFQPVHHRYTTCTQNTSFQFISPQIYTASANSLWCWVTLLLLWKHSGVTSGLTLTEPLFLWMQFLREEERTTAEIRCCCKTNTEWDTGHRQSSSMWQRSELLIISRTCSALFASFLENL